MVFNINARIQVRNVHTYIHLKERKTSHHLLLMLTKSTESKLPKIDLQNNTSIKLPPKNWHGFGNLIDRSSKYSNN